MVSNVTMQRHSQNSLRLGFIPLSDCAPIAVAQEKGLFKKHDLDISLSREMGWSTIRDKIYYGDLDAAQSIVVDRILGESKLQEHRHYRFSTLQPGQSSALVEGKEAWWAHQMGHVGNG